MHDIMRLNSDPEHIAHTISKYFEINQSKNAVLHLIKPEKKRTKIMLEEKPLIEIRGVKKC
jgi:hypothetical protein